MPTDACQWFYECENCKTVLRPEAGDCCVFCSYGTNKCPPIQAMARHAARAERRTGCLRRRVPPSSRHPVNAISGAERRVMPRRRRMLRASS